MFALVLLLAALLSPAPIALVKVHLLVIAVFISILVIFIYYAFCACPGSLEFGSALLTGEPPHVRESLTTHLYLWAGCICVAFAFAYLEIRQPFYFTQDDSLSQSLPMILQGVHSLAVGVFPTWNPYQYMGSPTTTVGDYALTYPPTYLSYWISKHLLRNEYFTVDVFCIFHLMAGYLITFWAIRREHCRPAVAMLGGLCCALSGYALIVGRSWFHMTPVFVWTPLLIGLLRSAIRSIPNWKWIGAFGLALGFFFHAGNAQMWAYCLLLLAIAVMVLITKRAIPPKTVVAIASATALGIAVSAPLLIPELFAIRGINRTMLIGGILEGLPTLFFPVSVIHTVHPLGWGGSYGNVLGEMYYSGTLFCVIGLLLLIGLIAFEWNSEVVKNNIWFLCALLALILALGREGFLWMILWKLPGFSKFRTAFKFLGLFNIFMAIAGAVALERLLRRWRWRTREDIVLCMLTIGLLAYHCNLSRGAFWVHGFRPYPRLDPNIRRLLQPRDNRDYPKLVSITIWRSESPGWFDSMYQQWPTLFGFFSLSGYEPLVEGVPEYQRMYSLTSDPDAFRHFGVKYFIVDRSLPELWDPEHGASRLFKNGPQTLQLSVAYHSSEVTVFELPNPEPMAFEEFRSDRPLPVTFDGAGATISTSEAKGKTIILNMLRRPEIRARADGQAVSVDSDRWYRIRIHLGENAKQVRIDFHPEWRLGFLSAFLGICVSVVLGMVSQYQPSKRKGEHGDTENLGKTLEPLRADQFGVPVLRK